jgi:hypothetical protein
LVRSARNFSDDGKGFDSCRSGGCPRFGRSIGRVAVVHRPRNLLCERSRNAGAGNQQGADNSAHLAKTLEVKDAVLFVTIRRMLKTREAAWLARS